MDAVTGGLVAAAAGYLCGSVPFPYLVVRARTGRDLRTVGSGNVGATNASRVLGRAWFLPIFLLDAAKGAGPVLAAPLVGGGAWAPAAAAMGAVLGHMFPLFLRFRGGKAVATGAGTLAILAPWAAAAGVAGFALAALPFRFVSLGSVVAAAAALCARHLAAAGGPRGAWTGDALPGTIFVTALSAFVVLRHIPNLRRIAAGTEPRIGEKRRPGGEPGEEASRA